MRGQCDEMANVYLLQVGNGVELDWDATSSVNWDLERERIWSWNQSSLCLPSMRAEEEEEEEEEGGKRRKRREEEGEGREEEEGQGHKQCQPQREGIEDKCGWTGEKIWLGAADWFVMNFAKGELGMAGCQIWNKTPAKAGYYKQKWKLNKQTNKQTNK